jgi:hypothetical protein
MTLKRRIGRLETRATARPGTEVPTAIVLQGVARGPAGLEVVSLALLWPGGADTVHLEREPGEDEAAFRARFDALAESAGKVPQHSGDAVEKCRD